LSVILFRFFMGNPTLFATSCLMALPHLLIVYLFPGSPVLLRILYLLGTCTSILNHATTCIFSRWLDRLVMTCGVPFDLWYAYQLECIQWITVLLLTIGSIVLYMATKFVGRVSFFHALAHACVSVSHFFMLFWWHSKASFVYN
jgi:hypothetical protein